MGASRLVAPQPAGSQAAASKRIVLCADDFGFSDASCRAIIELAGAGAISAASCVVDGPSTAAHAAVLRAAATCTSLGLHFNLTEPPTGALGAPLRANLRSWLLRTHVWRSVDVAAVRVELRRQLDSFEDLFGQAPAYLDGHEHVHQFPGIAAMLVDELVARYGTRIAVRSTVPYRWRGIKAQLIAGLGGVGLSRLLRSRQVASNSDFAGAYDFSLRVPYQRRMQAWMHSIADGGLIMCHPEHAPAGAVQAATPARQAEYAFLASLRWPALLQQCGAQLVPFGASSGECV